MKRIALTLGIGFALSLFVNVLLLVGRPPVGPRSYPAGPRATESRAPRQEQPERPLPVDEAALRREIDRLRRELAEATSARGQKDEKTQEKAVVALQQEQERAAAFWRDQERAAKEKGEMADADYRQEALMRAVEYLQLEGEAPERFIETVQFVFQTIDPIREELALAAEHARQAGVQQGDFEEYAQINRRMHSTLVDAAIRVEKILDRSRPRQNQFAMNVERWLALVAQPYRS